MLILILSITNLIISAYLSLKALEIREYNYLLISENVEPQKIKLIKNDAETALIIALKSKVLNDLRITKISNYISIAYKSIRNGVVGFALVLIILTIHSYLNPPSPGIQRHPLKGTVETLINDSTEIKSTVDLLFGNE